MPEDKMQVTIRLGRIAYLLIQQIDRNCSVEETIERICDHVQQGVYRPGSWERQWLRQCVGCDFEINLESGDPYNREEPGAWSPFQKPRNYMPPGPPPSFVAEERGRIERENRAAAIERGRTRGIE